MAVVKLLNLLAISCLAIIASYGPVPVAAVSVSNQHMQRSSLHHAMIKRKRAGTSKRCKHRSSTTPPAKATTYAQPAPTKSSSGGNNGGNDDDNNNNNNNNNDNDNNNNGGNSGSSGGAKVGIAWPEGNNVPLKRFKAPKVSKYYTWSPWSVSDSGGMEFCPMLWGHKQIGDFTKLVKPGYAKCVMGPNEPDQSRQANMSPGEAVNLWWKYIDGLSKQGYQTISPATTSSPQGKQWMKDFFASCQGCHVDAVALHWYGTDAQEFIKYVEDFYNTFKKPIWVTEYACQDFGPKHTKCSSEQVTQFMKTVTNWMDNTWYVQQYFAFGAMRDMSNVEDVNRLMTPAGWLTSLGLQYIGK